MPTRAARFVRLSSPMLAFWGGVREMAGLRVLADCDRTPLAGCVPDDRAALGTPQ
jgi:hypothetical protein